MKSENIQLLFAWLVTVTVLVTLTLMTSGCATQSRAEKYYSKNPGELAKACADKYPPTFAKGDSVIIPGDSAAYLQAIKDLHDGINALAGINDSLMAVLQQDPDCIQYASAIARLQTENSKLKQKSANVPCPKDVLKITDTVENFARVRALEFDVANRDITIGLLKDDLIKSQRETAGVKDDKGKWKKWCLLTWAAVVLFIGGRFALALMKAKKVLPV